MAILRIRALSGRSRRSWCCRWGDGGDSTSRMGMKGWECWGAGLGLFGFNSSRRDGFRGDGMTDWALLGREEGPGRKVCIIQHRLLHTGRKGFSFLFFLHRVAERLAFLENFFNINTLRCGCFFGRYPIHG